MRRKRDTQPSQTNTRGCTSRATGGFVASQKYRGYDIHTVTMKIIELCATAREANEPPLMEYVNYGFEAVAYQTGPFRAGDVAETHRRDIRAYDGVTTCYLARDRDEGRVFVESDWPVG